jgi:hypothetical protein
MDSRGGLSKMIVRMAQVLWLEAFLDFWVLVDTPQLLMLLFRSPKGLLQQWK